MQEEINAQEKRKRLRRIACGPLAAIKKLPLFQLDVKNAFQQGGSARTSFYSASSAGMQAK